MDDAWWKSSRHRMSQETVTGRFPSSCPEGEEGESGAPIPISVKSAVSSANNASWTPDDDGRGISFVYAEYSRGEGGALRNSCSDKTSCRTCVPPYRRPWLHQRRQLRCYVRFQSPPRHTLLSGGLAVDKNGLGESRTVHL
ncbi:hypothetical protein EVAR_33769_1 [Eumeta japonica]|uniref:Uncharacterized protein n=1 Tax=Eumeta variegata TaxID=151549 RepID=A0A4C1VVU0_EUMVA|nr:hypothetical protein EVAR_33769_1 [Eumeta japonica]